MTPPSADPPAPTSTETATTETGGAAILWRMGASGRRGMGSGCSRSSVAGGSRAGRRRQGRRGWRGGLRWSGPCREGTGMGRTCDNVGNATYNGDCCKGRLCKKKVIVAVGLLVTVIFAAAATACYFLLRYTPNERYRYDPEQSCLPKILAKARQTRVFTYQELNEATKGFNQDQKLVDIANESVHPGVLSDGSLVTVQRIRCQTKQNLNQILDRVEILSRNSHQNIAKIIGCCISSGHNLLLVHESFPNGALKDLLQPGRENGPLNWYRRINIATEVASGLAHFQSKISSSIKPHSLKSSDIYILPDYSVKIASFRLIDTVSTQVSHGADVVHNFGLILLELIVGTKCESIEEMILDKIKDRKFHEIADPCLRFEEQLPVQCEQIEKLAIFAVHCLSRRGLCMVAAAKEFIHIVNDNMAGSTSSEPSLENTFSNSSLLQMISMSPDVLHVH
ncbi:uncharacterized protein A4U43_C04F21780 [Asparagus officinalis]|uniref:Protein kinase domain-containing protein n=1 Tax=Asparagus officinalis TaxID=4686 RepID=A0A5P1F3C3_ASPOF|nr:uncharacterized protein A4U43_C04F21780 [Asparagus officinalis]